jgi:hypothetical protein
VKGCASNLATPKEGETFSAVHLRAALKAIIAHFYPNGESMVGITGTTMPSDVLNALKGMT